MKKSLIALAVLAASSAAMAQSTVTLYGRADVGVGSEKVNGESNSKMIDGGLTTSRWGLRGSEDLGGGLKAQFKFEQRVDMSTGAVQSPSFKGESSLGLSGGFGGVTVGRMTTVYDDVRALSYSSNVFDSSFTPASNGVFKSGGDYSSRYNSQLRYETPSMGGFYAALNYAFEQTTDKDDTMSGLKLGYKSGPMHLALALQNEKNSDTAKANDFMALSGSYDLGAAALSAGYNTRKGSAAKGDDTELTFGVNVPLGAVNLSAGYATSKTEVGSATSAKASGFGLGATYTLSKRTRLYAAYRTVDLKDGAGRKTSDSSLMGLGVRHDF